MSASSLAYIHDDILAVILESLFLDVMRLWLLGSKPLNIRIARCCRSFSTSPWNENHKPKKWPRMLSQLRSLQTLSINVTQFREDPHIISEQLRMLSPTLLHLNLQLKDAVASFCDLFESRPSNPSSTNSDDASTLDRLSKRHYTFWSIKEHFPLLKSLTIRHKGSFRFSATVSPFFEVLPDSLETLNWSGTLEDEDELLSLPRGLTTLISRKQSSFELVNPSVLPPGLTHLTVVFVSSIQALSWLPRSLRSGDWLKRTLSYFDEIDSKFLAALPSGLNALVGPLFVSSTTLEPSWPLLLPQTLTKFQVENPPLNASTIASLPRTIVKLINISLDYGDLRAMSLAEGLDEVLNIWPPNLTSITLGVLCDPIEASMVGIFPSTLLNLQHVHVAQQTDLLRHAAMLPPLLTRLNVVHYGLDVYWNVIDPLPVNLKVLEMGRIRLSSSSFEKLPRGLKKLVIYHMQPLYDIEPSHLLKLPQGIEILHISWFQVNDLQYLPRSLHTLYAAVMVHRLYTLPILLPPSLDRVFVDSSRPHLFHSKGRFSHSQNPENLGIPNLQLDVKPIPKYSTIKPPSSWKQGAKKMISLVLSLMEIYNKITLVKVLLGYVLSSTLRGSNDEASSEASF